MFYIQEKVKNMPTNRETYLATFDELHVLGTTLYQDYSQGKKSVKEVIEECENFFIYAYLLGYRIGGDDIDIGEDEAMYYLNTVKDTDKPLQSVFATFEEDGKEKDFEDCLREHLENEEGASSIEKVLATEWHRNTNRGIQDFATDYSVATGIDLKKVWHTVLDDKVRDTHSYLEGMEVGIDEEFYTYNGNHALYPGQFANASEDVNCRCSVQLKKGKTTEI